MGQRMGKIFIDANIYLDFYILGQPKYQKLLPTLVAAKNDIFVSKQIVDEVRRNKCKKFLLHAEQFYATLPKKFNLPSFTPTGGTAAKKWSKRISDLEKELIACASDYENSISAVAKSISTSTDRVSKELEKLFKNAATPTAIQLERARLRKELGNPPGKRSDPLGDQLSWEQFLDLLKQGEKISIITRDSDYFDIVFGEVRLKAPLETEVREKIGRRGDIYCFTDLIAGLTHASKHGNSAVKNLPNKNQEKEIRREQVNTAGTAIIVNPSMTSGGIESATLPSFYLRPNTQGIVNTSSLLFGTSPSEIRFNRYMPNETFPSTTFGLKPTTIPIGGVGVITPNTITGLSIEAGPLSSSILTGWRCIHCGVLNSILTDPSQCKVCKKDRHSI
jgi:hypothetical protein